MVRSPNVTSKTTHAVFICGQVNNIPLCLSTKGKATKRHKIYKKQKQRGVILYLFVAFPFVDKETPSLKTWLHL